MLTETQHKFDKVDLGMGYKSLTSMRDMQDKKGGGLLICTRNDVDMVEKENSNPDVLWVEIKIKQLTFDVALCYWDVRYGERNKKIIGNLKKIIEENKDKKLMVLGDFNAHIGILGEQEVNQNGEEMIRFVEDAGLILLNIDRECTGEITRNFRDQKSVIDYVMVNDRLYGDFLKMEIDEDKRKYDLSDHCMISISLKIQEDCNNNYVTEESEYFKVSDDLKEEFIKSLERKVRMSIGHELTLHEMITATAEENLKRKKKLRTNTSTLEQEAVWMTDEIKEEIKKRKLINREKRYLEGDEKERCWSRYLSQKKKVSELVREEVRKYESVITNEIKESKDGYKKMWKHIERLKGTGKQEKESQVYDGDGKLIDGKDLKRKFRETWKRIYQMHEDDIENVWNHEIKQSYIENDYKNANDARAVYRDVLTVGGGVFSLEDMVVNIPSQLAEHYDMTRCNIERGVECKMDEVRIEIKDVRKALRNLKNGKQAGPDGMKPEIYKWLLGSDVCLKKLLEDFNWILNMGVPPEEWKTSKTVMIPKVRRPKLNEFRPIALTNIEYKIFMKIIKDKLLEHFSNNDDISVYQMGFTRGRRTEDNLFMLQYAVESSRKDKKELIVTFIDFAKAFDSIQRSNLIECLKHAKIDPKVIEIVTQIYKEDVTKFYLNKNEIGEMKVKNGIRQGCTCSPQFFLMAVNRIIKAMERKGLGFKNDSVYMPLIFFADDGVLLSNSVRDMERMIDLLVEEAAKIGMEVNKEKCNVMVFNRKNELDNIRMMKVVKEAKYLGVWISDGKDYFKKHKELVIGKARKMANMTFSVIHKSCNKLLIGKTYWKNVVLPSLLHGNSVITWNTTDIDKLQRSENAVWRTILGAPQYSPLVTLQGEVGSSNMMARDMKKKIDYARHLKESNNELLVRLYEDIRSWKRGKWIDTISKYNNLLNITEGEQMEMTKEDIKRRVYEFDGLRWRQEMGEKTTLTLYSRHKTEIRQEEIYENDWSSVLLFRCRTNTLKLNWRERFTGGDTRCKNCYNEEESLEHFLVDCPWYRGVRGLHGMEGQPVGEVLFGGTNLTWARPRRMYLEHMWKRRKEMEEGADCSNIGNENPV